MDRLLPHQLVFVIIEIKTPELLQKMQALRVFQHESCERSRKRSCMETRKRKNLVHKAKIPILKHFQASLNIHSLPYIVGLRVKQRAFSDRITSDENRRRITEDVMFSAQKPACGIASAKNCIWIPG